MAPMRLFQRVLAPLACALFALGTGISQPLDMKETSRFLSGWDSVLHPYFCHAETFLPINPGDIVVEQGSVVSICFEVIGGQFDVDDVLSLVVTDMEKAHRNSQNIVVDDVAEDGWAGKWCTPKSTTTTTSLHTCVVSFLLKPAFFDYDKIQLTAEGALVVELKQHGSRRKRLLSSNMPSWQQRALVGSTVATFTVEPMTFSMVKNPDYEYPDESSAVATTTIYSAFAWVVMNIAVTLQLLGRV
ncbi:expressed unknown protein [Seminavis robusta]|uniref:Uncharacterized protein n=1 Tax=Seminavis robusta TaxID=568900 RepID=A0A9N8DSJ1_9STRA|nr:expressed unknown protein [Seminavis robusta]|eukprot:Sro321_g116730.1 n/a (244) ;mRNA; r:35649-36517